MQLNGRGAWLGRVLCAGACQRVLFGLGIIALAAVVFAYEDRSMGMPAGDLDMVTQAASGEWEPLPTDLTATPVPPMLQQVESAERPHIGPIPEPGTFALLILGLGTMLYRSPRRQQAKPDAPA